VRLVDADLTGVSAIQAHLAHARLSGARLTDGTFDQADLSGADLTGADLSGAGLIQADLSGTTLDGVTGGPSTLRWAAILSGLVGLVIVAMAARSLLRRSRAATAAPETVGAAGGMPIYGASGGFAAAGGYGGLGSGRAATSGPPTTATVVGVMGGAVAIATGLFLMVTGLAGTVLDQLSPLATVAGAPVIGRFAVSPTCLVLGSLLFTGGIIVRSFAGRLT
jgi:hypothetical protein